MLEAQSQDALESARIAPLRPALAAVAAVVLIAGAMGGLWLLFHAMVPNYTASPPQAFPAPEVRPDQGDELKALTAGQKLRLAGYRWVDRDKQIVSIPIDRAMALEAGRGADGYKPITATPLPADGRQRQ